MLLTPDFRFLSIMLTIWGSAFIALSNRDEYFQRPTSRAKFWNPPHDDVLGPYDLARPEHGTWIGISKKGRLAILLNFHELNASKHKGLISRGLFPKEFLESDEPTEEWINNAYKKYGEEGLKDSGGFTMFCGVLRQSKVSSDKIEPFGLLSNRGAPALKLFASGMVDKDESIVINDSVPYAPTNSDIRSDTISISNSQVTEPWPKVHLGVQSLDEIVHQSPVSEEHLIKQLKEILVKNTFPLEIAKQEKATDDVFYHVRKSIFVPPINVSLPDNSDLGDGTYYGTRTNTIILVSKTGHVKYIERTLHEHDTPVEGYPTQESVFEFDIEGFSS